MGYGGAWLRSFEYGFKWYCQDKGIKTSITDGKGDASTQVQRSLDLLRKDIDAFFISPIDSKALVKVVEKAKGKGIPVFTANSTASTKDVKLFTAFGNDKAAATCADNLVQLLKKRTGSASGDVIELVLPQKSHTFKQRHTGFDNRIKKESDVNIINQVSITSGQTSEVVKKLSPVLQRNPNVDAIYCPDQDTGLGAVTALENANMKKKAGNDGHVMVSSIDASHAVLKNIKQGYMDLVVDQPNFFYLPISVHYAQKYIEAGNDDSVLPQPGQKITASDLTISGNKHMGVNVWQKPLWAPANIIDVDVSDGKQTQFETSGIVITKDSKIIDAPYLWGNLSPKYSG